MAQLVARLVRNEKVGGSNPPSSTTSKGLSRQVPGGTDLFQRSGRLEWVIGVNTMLWAGRRGVSGCVLPSLAWL